METDLIFDAETSDNLFAETTQIAAAAGSSEGPLPASLLEAARVVIPAGASVVRIAVAPGEVVELPFPSDAQFLARIDDGNLAIRVGDVTVILQGYVAAADQAPPVIETADGQRLDIAAILAATDPAIEIETAAGPAGAQGQGADNTGALLTQFAGAGGGLGGFSSVGGQDDSNAPSGGPGVDQTGTLFRQFGEITPTAPVAPDFEFDTDEESKISGKVVATDPQGDPLQYSLVGATPLGLTFNADGSWSFDPAGKYDQLNTDSPGQVSFQYKANDGVNDSNTATVTIDIAGVNDAPQVFGISDIGFSEDTPPPLVPLDWQIIDPDDTQHTIEVDQSTLPPGVTYDADTGRLVFDALGRYDYLAEGETGEFTVKFTITDAHGASVDHDVTVSVVGANDAPIAVDDTVLTNSGTAKFEIPEWALLANDKDPDDTFKDVAQVGFVSGFNDHQFTPGSGPNGKVALWDGAPLGGSFAYKATDGADESGFANVGVKNQSGGDIAGTDADEILIGTGGSETIDGGAGNDIIFGRGYSIESENLLGGAGDDVIAFEPFTHIFGGTDNLSPSGGLAESATKRGDVLALKEGVNFAEAPEYISLDGIETISTEEKFGGFGSQTVALDAAAVQKLSDHTITPGGGYGEHEAIRIDGDSPDFVYLSTGNGGGKWVDTGIELAGYRIYAHETTEGDPGSTDTYVMVEAANVDNVRLNLEAPVAVDDYLVTNNGPNPFLVPDWALTANDKNVNAEVVETVSNSAEVELDLAAQPGQLGVTDKGAPGAIFQYGADNGKDIVRANVSMTNQAGGDIVGTGQNEIIVGTKGDENIEGGAGNDIIIGGGSDDLGDRIFGQAGDDIIAYDREAEIDGGHDSVSPNGGLAVASQHGDRLVLQSNASFRIESEVAGIETISTEEKYGGTGAQTVTIDAAAVQETSDHRITPGGGYGQHTAVRIDGDAVDRLYLAAGGDGGQWTDTGIDMGGYRIYAYETSPGNPASTNAYVMVQLANVGNVQLNQDASPVAVADTVLSNFGTLGAIEFPEWALLRNDKGQDGAALDVGDVANIVSYAMFTKSSGNGANGNLEFRDDAALGGSFDYTAVDGDAESDYATVTIQNQSGGDLAGTAADEILVGTGAGEKLEGGGGNDLIFGGGGGLFDFDSVSGDAGDDIIAFAKFTHIDGGSDSVALSGGLAAGADQHGDVLFATTDLDLVNSMSLGAFGGIETLSTEIKFGGIGAQSVTLGASSVQQLSDHTITPGGVFAEHEAIRIDGDAVDELYLSISKDGGKWVDTGLSVAGYQVYAHQATEGDAASTDAYVMVQSANTGNVHLNQDAP